MVSDSDSLFGSLLTSSGILFVGLACRLGLGFLGRLVIARGLGKVDYGAISLGMTVMMGATVLVVIGTDTGVGRYLPRFDDISRRRGVLLSAYQIVVPLSIFIGFVVVLSARIIAINVFHDPNLTTILRIFGFTVPLLAFVRLTVGSIRGMKEAFPRVLIQNLTVPIARIILIVVAVIAGLGSIGVAAAYAGAYAAATLLSIVYLIRRTPLFESTKAITMRRDLVSFSAPLMITATMFMILSNFDTLMIGAFASTGDVGVYNVAYPLSNLLTITLTAFAFIFMPTISELHSDGKTDEMKRTFEVVSKWILLATLPLFLILVSYPSLVIRNTFGAEYTNGALTLSVLAVGFFAHTIAGPSGDMLTAVGKQRLVMYDNILVAGINVVLNLLLIPRFSYLGAAIATTLSYFLMNAIYLIFVYREVGVHPFRDEFIYPAVVAGAVWVLIYKSADIFLASSLTTLLSTQTLFLLLYMIIILRFGGVESEELSLINSFENRTKLNLDPLRTFARYFVR
jgi:O-antigen/teichoic acid export membrane protein